MDKLTSMKIMASGENHWPISLHEWDELRSTLVMDQDRNTAKLLGDIYVFIVSSDKEYPNITDIMLEVDDYNEDIIYEYGDNAGLSPKDISFLISVYHNAAVGLENIVVMVLDLMGLIYFGITEEDLINMSYYQEGTSFIFVQLLRRGYRELSKNSRRDSAPRYCN